jgi:hypothetical protein
MIMVPRRAEDAAGFPFGKPTELGPMPLRPKSHGLGG